MMNIFGNHMTQRQNKKTLFVLFLICYSFFVFSQDQLFKKDNTKLEVKILEINPTEIKYKLFTYPDGPTIILAKADVAMVIYQNGVHEVFNTPPPQPATVIQYKSTADRINERNLEKKAKFEAATATKNLVSFNMLEFINGSVGVSYLKEFAHNYLHVYVPVSFGFATPSFNQSLFNERPYYDYYGRVYVTNFRYTKKTAEIGLGIHLQTSGKRVVTHFIGPYVGYAQFNGTFDQTITSNLDTNGIYRDYTYVNRGFVMNRMYFMIDNGLLIRATKHFNILALISVGYHTDDYIANNPATYDQNSSYYYRYSSPLNSFKIGLSMGYRF